MFFFDFGEKSVALCGAMKNSCFLLFLQKCVFFDFGEKSVALCGAMKNSCFLLFLQKMCFF